MPDGHAEGYVECDHVWIRYQEPLEEYYPEGSYPFEDGPVHCYCGEEAVYKVRANFVYEKEREGRMKAWGPEYHSHDLTAWRCEKHKFTEETADFHRDIEQ